MRVLSLLRVGYYLALATSSACGIADAAATPPLCKGTTCTRQASLPPMRRQYIPTRRQYNSTGLNSTESTGPPYFINSTLPFTPATGVPGGDIVSRLPIKKLRDTQPDVFNMYILAVDSFMKKNDSDWMSWFRISGIHGFPYQPFQYPDSSIVNPGMGYCTHHSVIFLPWHRPYLALMEQALNAEACAIALRFTDPDEQQRWHDAAEKLRQPYWDWSDARQQVLPSIVTTKTVTVTMPGPDGASTQTAIPNPLLKYVPPEQYVANIGQETTRDPGASADLRSTFPARKQQTVDLFAISDYDRFQEQLESIHDSIHITVGGSMAVINYAAFDPIFWLHHTNVDRLMAMYQNIQPNKTMTPGPRSPTLALGGDVNDTSTTPLYPFRHPDGIEWTPEDLESYSCIFRLGYSYPEVQPKQTAKRGNNPNSASRNHTVSQVNSLYAPDNATEQTLLEWNAVLLVDTSEFTESCKIKIFIAPTANATDSLVGLAPVFIGEPGSKGVDTRVNTTIPLTQALKDRGLGSLDPKDVVPALTSGLSWAIEKVASSETVPLESIESLKVGVYSREASYAANKVPTKGGATVYCRATGGKQGGWTEGDPPILDSAVVTTVSEA